MIEIPTPMHRFDIQAGLKKVGVTQQEIAESLDPEVDRATVSQVISSTGKSARIQRRIASLLCGSFEKVWGKPDPDQPI